MDYNEVYNSFHNNNNNNIQCNSFLFTLWCITIVVILFSSWWHFCVLNIPIILFCGHNTAPLEEEEKGFCGAWITLIVTQCMMR